MAVLWGCTAVVLPNNYPISREPMDSGHVMADGGLDEQAPVNFLESFLRTGAQSVCRALFRCCPSRVREEFIRPLMDDSRLSDSMRSQLPPTESACQTVLTEVFRIVQFGDWMDALQRGQARFDPEGVRACETPLVGTCGLGLSEALFDPECYYAGFSLWGSRRMFQPTANVGQMCRRIRDARFVSSPYGSCDPSTAFCCLPDQHNPRRCLSPDDPAGTSVVSGICRPIAQEGSRCEPDIFTKRSYLPCAPRMICEGDPGARYCARLNTTPLQPGDWCMDAVSRRVLGLCPQGFSCDAPSRAEETGTYRCVVVRANGQPCTNDRQCSSQSCRGTCQATENIYRCNGI